MTLLWNVCKNVCKYVGIGTDEETPITTWDRDNRARESVQRCPIHECLAIDDLGFALQIHLVSANPGFDTYIHTYIHT